MSGTNIENDKQNFTKTTNRKLIWLRFQQIRKTHKYKWIVYCALPALFVGTILGFTLFRSDTAWYYIFDDILLIILSIGLFCLLGLELLDDLFSRKTLQDK